MNLYSGDSFDSNSTSIPSLIDLYETKNSSWCGKILKTDLLYVECGREQKMPIRKEDYPSVEELVRSSISSKDDDLFLKKMQVTVRDVQLDESIQKKGIFTRFVKYLLNTVGPVQLESIQPHWLKVRLERSPLWIRQTPFEYKHINPTYARITINEPFTLF